MRRVFFLCVVIALCPNSGRADSKAASDASSPASIAKPDDTSAPLAVGDYWTYEQTDGITGKTKNITFTVTDLTPKAIAERSIAGDDPRTMGSTVYNRSWDMVRNNAWRFIPDDGLGIRSPLTVGKSWSFRDNSMNVANRVIRRRLGSVKVVGQEKLKTEAGVFDTYKIQASWKARDTRNPEMIFEYDLTRWFAPAINHWVKIVSVFRTDGLVRERVTLTLTKWGHAKAAADTAK